VVSGLAVCSGLDDSSPAATPIEGNWFGSGSRHENSGMRTTLDNGQRLPRKLLRAVVARLLGRN
jgi:hypothetical protein